MAHILQFQNSMTPLLTHKHLKHKEYPKLTSVISIPLNELNHEIIKKASTRSHTFYAQSFHK
jgi:hypothetical protein